MKVENKFIDKQVDEYRARHANKSLKGKNKLARKMYRNMVRDSLRRKRLEEIKKRGGK